MKTEKMIFTAAALLLFCCANSFILLRRFPQLIPIVMAVLLLCNTAPLYTRRKLPDIRTHFCDHGVKCLKLFLITATMSAVFHMVLAFVLLPENWSIWVFSALVCIAAEAVVFWNGIISVYAASVQLGIRIRIIGILLGFIPVANIIALLKIIRTVDAEVAFETQKYAADLSRKDEFVCATRYPILFVHGVFFRDTKLFNYWGRIPQALETNGARIYYGEHESAASIKDSATELAQRIRTIITQTGCEKVNIIAHSKGGLDCRYAIAHAEVSPYIASLTTVNTPHRGCLFADYLLEKAPEKFKNTVAAAYNAAARKCGDKNPDFLAAVYDLTSAHCSIIDRETVMPEDIFCQSIGSKLNHASGGKFPLNFSYVLSKHFDGDNDGLVGEHSFKCGEHYTFLTVNGKRGISHGDMIDLNRENIPGFDVREFYVQLVAGLKKRGL